MKRETMRTRGTGKAALDAARSGLSREEAAHVAKLSIPMITWARRILHLGCAQLVAAVENGTVALHVAARVARWPESSQHEFLSLGSEDVTITVRCIAVPAVPARVEVERAACASPDVSVAPMLARPL